MDYKKNENYGIFRIRLHNATNKYSIVHMRTDTKFWFDIATARKKLKVYQKEWQDPNTVYALGKKKQDKVNIKIGYLDSSKIEQWSVDGTFHYAVKSNYWKAEKANSYLEFIG